MKLKLPHRLAFNIAAIVWTVVLVSPLAQGESGNSELSFALKHDLLVLINKDRAAHGLNPVQLDPHASEVADAYCRRQIKNGTTGHFTIDGQTPYMRYSLAGGNDGLSENAAAWSANYSFAEEVIPVLIRRSQQAMLAEVAPHDGHRRTILDPNATHVGLGLAWEKGEFRLAQEFLRRYLQWEQPLPRAATVSDRITGGGRPIEGHRVDAVSIYHEPFPQAMLASMANRIETYGLPKNRRDYVPRAQSSGERALRLAGNRRTTRPSDFIVRRDGSFFFSVPFADGPGIYTIVVWVRPRGEKTAIAASNISIRVDQVSDFSRASIGSY